jgi:phosphatidylglycerophosphatase A
VKRLHLALASVFGAGYFPIASGTFASALALIPWFWLRDRPWLYAAVTLGACVLGVWTATEAEYILQEKDSHKIVIDEVAGMWIAAAYLPRHWFNPVAAFVLFRIFDVWKPFPARQSQVLPGGWGVMIDDVIVAVYANLLLQITRLFLPF